MNLKTAGSESAVASTKLIAEYKNLEGHHDLLVRVLKFLKKTNKENETAATNGRASSFVQVQMDKKAAAAAEVTVGRVPASPKMSAAPQIYHAALAESPEDAGNSVQLVVESLLSAVKLEQQGVAQAIQENHTTYAAQAREYGALIADGEKIVADARNARISATQKKAAVEGKLKSLDEQRAALNTEWKDVFSNPVDKQCGMLLQLQGFSRKDPAVAATPLEKQNPHVKLGVNYWYYKQAWERLDSAKEDIIQAASVVRGVIEEIGMEQSDGTASLKNGAAILGDKQAVSENSNSYDQAAMTAESSQRKRFS